MIGTIIGIATVAFCWYLYHKHVQRTRFEQIYLFSRKCIEMEVAPSYGDDIEVKDKSVWNSVISNVVFDFIHMDFLRKPWIGEPFEHLALKPTEAIISIKDHYKSWKAIKNNHASPIAFKPSVGLEKYGYVYKSLKLRTVKEHLIVILTIYGNMSDGLFKELIEL